MYVCYGISDCRHRLLTTCNILIFIIVSYILIKSWNIHFHQNKYTWWVFEEVCYFLFLTTRKGVWQMHNIRIKRRWLFFKEVVCVYDEISQDQSLVTFYVTIVETALRLISNYEFNLERSLLSTEIRKSINNFSFFLH